MFKVGSIFIPVTNMEKSMAWYEKNLGVKMIDQWDEGAGFYFPNSSTQMALVQVQNPQPTEFVIKGNKKNVYFNFLVEDIEEVYDHLNNNGVVTTEIEDFGGMKGFDFFDLDENPFSVVNEDKSSPYYRENVRRLQGNISI
ncbi:putative enzyme related to lactoylglutathione lyase [Bacillus pakistanensis]|uniref:Enzyme related to lactoylglutathione lyase n=1 Tax=Rossellomorea pakistanensis TaxID=992288 RepID=A0ABS2NI13_9BACI|nr:VOC family protein [Bacillus pakistanensis]MBM7587465.1 putative enzyme related to lactoylglutathione lyase [Bacillus pakistanensis]